MSLRRKETANPLYHHIPADDDVDKNTNPLEPEGTHIKEKERLTRRRFGPLALLVTFLLSLSVIIAGHSVHEGAGEKKAPPEADASAANAKKIEEDIDAAANARLGPRMIFCYGDALASGTTSNGTYPYGKYLEQELNTLYDPTSEPASAKSESQKKTQATLVHHLGLPGWTASQMLDHLHDGKMGMCKIVHSIPQLDLMVILSGTNEIGQMTQVGTTSSKDIVKSIIDLHKGVINCAVEQEGSKWFHTLAVGIPGSKHQELTSHVNNALAVFASEFSGRVSYMDFPFPYEEGDPKWDAGGLFLTQQGYQALARELAPHVKNILEKIGLK